jgi:hypothetical protein
MGRSTKDVRMVFAAIIKLYLSDPETVTKLYIILIFNAYLGARLPDGSCKTIYEFYYLIEA